MDLDPHVTHILHRNAIITRTGELDVSQMGEAINGVVQKQTIADDPLDPLRLAGEGITLLFHITDLMTCFFEKRKVPLGISPRSGNQKMHNTYYFFAARSALISSTVMATAETSSFRFSVKYWA